jgi:hypothetical protein
MSYSSAEHVSKNENGREEVTLERTIGVIGWLLRVVTQRSFKVSWTQKDTWELCFDTVWVHKDSEEIASKKLSLDLFEARRNLTCFMDEIPPQYNTPWRDIKKVIGELYI